MLGPNIQLCGEMLESGFEAKLWLVQRDGKFLQVTELLYRIMEHADGQRTLAQIAAIVSQTVGRGVSADNVRQLIAAKLIPKGLIAKADGSVDMALPSAARLRSPLAVNLRRRVIGPQYVDPIARVLQVLFMPPILLALLLLAGVGHGWIFFGHSFGQTIQTVLATPALLLVLLPINIATGVVHEFGHAAALRYGGGRARGIGVGFYLSYPVFYTDVTDSYRLGRWARIRVDLGGIYFNLLFQLGLIALYLLTGHPFFVLAVLLLSLQLVNEFTPFVRFDGYWTLADLTGIPDFFSQMGPFLRTVLPLPWWKGPKLPNLKGWVKAVFAIYILVTIPLLSVLLWLMVKVLPTTVMAIWQSFLQQITAFAGAWDAGEGLGMAVAIVGMLPLALSTFGLFLILFNSAYRGFGSLWNWSKPTARRRAIGALVVCGIAAVVSSLWTPQLSVTHASSDTKASQIQSIAPDGETTADAPTSAPSATPAASAPAQTAGLGAAAGEPTPLPPTPTPEPSATPTTAPPVMTSMDLAQSMLQQVAQAEANLKTGQLEAAIDYGTGVQATAIVRFDFGDRPAEPRFHTLTTYQGADGVQTVERITIDAHTWQHQSDGTWLAVSDQAGVWDQIQAFLPHANSAATPTLTLSSSTGELRWHDTSDEVDVTLIFDATTGIPQQLQRLSQTTGLLLTVTYTGWNSPVEITPPAADPAHPSSSAAPPTLPTARASSAVPDIALADASSPLPATPTMPPGNMSRVASALRLHNVIVAVTMPYGG